MKLLERQILDRFRLRFLYQNLRIALLLFCMMLRSCTNYFFPEEGEMTEVQFLTT